jgi:DNA-binding protein YbaB
VFDRGWGPTGDSADRWIDEWSAEAAAQAERARALSERVAELTVTATSDDGLVEVTVAGSGLVTDIRLADRVNSWRASAIAAEILAVMRRAQAELAGFVADAVADTVGADSPAGRAVVDSFARRFPAEPDDEDMSGRSRHGRRR